MIAPDRLTWIDSQKSVNDVATHSIPMNTNFQKNDLENAENSVSSTLSSIFPGLPIVNVKKIPRHQGHCGLECGHKKYKTTDGRRFVLTSAFPSLGDPCYYRQPKVKKKFNLLTKKAKVSELQRINNKKQAQEFDDRYYSFTEMAPFKELEVEAFRADFNFLRNITLACTKNRRHSGHSEEDDDQGIYDRSVNISNDPLLKDYVGCEGFWPVHSSGPKSHFADAITLSHLFEITALPGGNDECAEDLKMRAARARVTKRRRNGTETLDISDLMLGATLALVSSQLGTTNPSTSQMSAIDCKQYQNGGPPAKRHCPGTPTTSASTPHGHEQQHLGLIAGQHRQQKETLKQLPSPSTLKTVAECRDFWTCANNKERTCLIRKRERSETPEQQAAHKLKDTDQNQDSEKIENSQQGSRTPETESDQSNISSADEDEDELKTLAIKKAMDEDEPRRSSRVMKMMLGTPRSVKEFPQPTF
mgnify:CR=1 FL=1|jgi:hypothetical protein